MREAGVVADPTRGGGDAFATNAPAGIRGRGPRTRVEHVTPPSAADAHAELR